MKNNTNTPDTLKENIAALVEYSKQKYNVQANNEEALTLCGAQLAIMKKLAEVLGSCWLFGADMVEYRDQVENALAKIEANAEVMAYVADIDTAEYFKQALKEEHDRVMHFALKTDNHTIKNEEPAQEVAEKPAAGSLEQLRAEREEVAELYALSSRNYDRLTGKKEAAKEKARVAAGRGDREAWNKYENEVLALHDEQQKALSLYLGDQALLDSLDNRIAYLEGLEDSKVEPLAEVVAAVDWAVEDCIFCNSDEFRALPESVQVFWHDCRYEELARNTNATEYANAFDAFFDCVANDLAIQQGEQWAATYDLDTVAKSLRLAFAKHFAA